MKSFVTLSLILSLLSFSFAQPTINTGSTRGSLSSSSLTLNDGRYYRSYCFYPRRGQDFTVRMMSNQLDAYLYLFSPSGIRWVNDDGGQGTDALIRIRNAQETGCWQIVATSFRRSTGSYTLQIDDAARIDVGTAAIGAGVVIGVACWLLGYCE